MANIFPFIDPQEVDIESNDEVTRAEEWAWDMEKERFKYRNSKMYKVYDNEAIKIWLWKLFRTPRFRYLIHNWDYGHELEDLIGQGYTQGYLNSEAERYVRDAIEFNLSDYITNIRNLVTSFDNGTLTIEFIAITIYGEVKFTDVI